MKNFSLLLAVFTVLMISACGRAPDSSRSAVSPLVTPSVATPIASTPESVPAPVDVPSSTVVPTIPSAPLEATLIALVAPYGGITATLPMTVVTLANDAMLNDVATREAGFHATATAWAALPINMGTPTVLAPRADGLDLDDPASWLRFEGKTGISFDYLASRLAFSLNDSETDSPSSDAVTFAESEDFHAHPKLDSVHWASAAHGTESVAADPDWPDYLGKMISVNWAVEVDVPQTSETWLYVTGQRNTYPTPGNQEFWSTSPMLTVQLFNERCNMFLYLSTDFGAPGPVVDALAKPLDQVVAEHFPVLDHMYRSVEFPAECE